MKDKLDDLIQQLKEIRTYLIKLGPSRRKGEVLVRKLNEATNVNKHHLALLKLTHEQEESGQLSDKDIENINTLPKDEKEAKSFVALANYYRKIIPNFAEKAHYLNKLSKKNVKFDWNQDCQHSFETLKEALSTPPVLQYRDFNPNNEFVLHTDASGYAIGAELSNSNGRPIAYASRSLNKAEHNYATIEK